MESAHQLSDLVAAIQQRCLPLPCALVFRQFHEFLIGVCRRTMIPGKIFTIFAKFKGIVCETATVESWLSHTTKSRGKQGRSIQGEISQYLLDTQLYQKRTVKNAKLKQ